MTTFRTRAYFDVLPSAFRLPPSKIRHPRSSLHRPCRAEAPREGGFTLIELLVVMGIITALLVAVVPAVTSLSKAHGQKAAVSNVMNVLEQARSLAVTNGCATYVVFADQTTPEKYRNKAYIVFKEDAQTFTPAAITKWYFLPTGISFQPNMGLLTAPAATPVVKFTCPGEIGTTPAALPYLKFDANGMVALPTDPNILFANVFAGSVDGGGVPTYTDRAQQNSQKFDQVAIARFTGRARYVDPYL